MRIYISQMGPAQRQWLENHFITRTQNSLYRWAFPSEQYFPPKIGVPGTPAWVVGHTGWIEPVDMDGRYKGVLIYEVFQEDNVELKQLKIRITAEEYMQFRWLQHATYFRSLSLWRAVAHLIKDRDDLDPEFLELFNKHSDPKNHLTSKMFVYGLKKKQGGLTMIFDFIIDGEKQQRRYTFDLDPKPAKQLQKAAKQLQVEYEGEHLAEALLEEGLAKFDRYQLRIYGATEWKDKVELAGQLQTVMDALEEPNGVPGGNEKKAAVEIIVSSLLEQIAEAVSAVADGNQCLAGVALKTYADLLTDTTRAIWKTGGGEGKVPWHPAVPYADELHRYQPEYLQKLVDAGKASPVELQSAMLIGLQDYLGNAAEIGPEEYRKYFAWVQTLLAKIVTRPEEDEE